VNTGKVYSDAMGESERGFGVVELHGGIRPSKRRAQLDMVVVSIKSV